MQIRTLALRSLRAAETPHPRRHPWADGCRLLKFVCPDAVFVGGFIPRVETVG
jgi:hypothetical protein